MFINEWNGWKWECVHCENTEIATDNEIKKYESELSNSLSSPECFISADSNSEV